MPQTSDTSSGATGSGKVIDLRGHRAAEQALDLLTTVDPNRAGYPAMLAGALSIGAPLLAAVSRRLDATRPRELSSLGAIVAAYPRRSEVTNALLRVVHDRRNSDDRRMGAMLLLDYFLGVPPADNFLSTLREPARAVAISLTSALDSGADDPTLLYDYLRALREQPLDVVYAVLGKLADLRTPSAVEVLRLIAMQPDPDLMSGAVDALTAQGTQRAIRALSILELNLPPEPAKVVGRSLQKLRLSGLSIEPFSPPDDRCRALVSPVDGLGSRVVWLALPITGGKATDYACVGLVLSDLVGIDEAVGISTANTPRLPPHAQVGTLHTGAGNLATGFAGAVEPRTGSVLLEAPFIYGLQLTLDAVQQNWVSGAPLPIDYQLMCNILWEYGLGLRTEAATPPRTIATERTPFAESDADLLFDPLFESWYLRGPEVEEVAREVAEMEGDMPHALSDESWRLLLPALIRLAHEQFSVATCSRYASCLRKMGEWLYIAGREQEAYLALSAARTIVQSPPEANLFVLRLVQRGILVALSDLLARRTART